MDGLCRQCRCLSITRSALYEAAKSGHKRCLGAVIQSGVDADSMAQAVKVVAERGYIKCLELLLEAGGQGKCPALIAAVTRGRHKCVNLLLKVLAKENLVWDKTKALELAVKHGYVKCTELLLQAGANKNAICEDGESPLCIAVKNGHHKVMKLLIQVGADVNIIDGGHNTLLHFAVEEGDDESLEMLLSAGATVNAVDQYLNTPLLLAAEYQHPELIKLLIKAGADVNSENLNYHSVLFNVVKNSDDKSLELLIEAGVHVNIRNVRAQTALMKSASGRNNRCMELLLQAGADINAQDNCYGKTALVIAAESGNTVGLSMLIQSGADLNILTLVLDTAVIAAIMKRNDKCVKLLLEAGACVNIPDKYTPLIRLTKRGNVKYVKLLINAGADVNHKGQYNQTALHCAANRGSEQCLKLLLEAGADVNVCDEDGKTALYLALQQHQFKCFCLLLEAGPLTVGLSQGQRPILHCALGICGKAIAALKRLLKLNVNINHLTNGQNSLTVAIRVQLNIKPCILLYVAGETLPKWASSLCKAKLDCIIDILKGKGTDMNMTLYNWKSIVGNKLCNETSRNQSDFTLMDMCRDVIREHMLLIDYHGNLFVRVPQLGLPSILTSYLLYNMSLEPEESDDGDD